MAAQAGTMGFRRKHGRPFLMSVFEHINGDGYEQVVYCSDDQSGLRAIIAIHSTALGPALGGTRF